jgi:hypothetical protein
MNFGFNVKYNKSLTNPQGKVNIIFRRIESDGILHTYQIQTNSIKSLSVIVNKATSGGTAGFTASANIVDITNPLNKLSVASGANFQMTITDNGEPGKTDSIGITVWDKNNVNLLFSSNWTGSKTVEQILGGGNLQVH